MGRALLWCALVVWAAHPAVVAARDADATRRLLAVEPRSPWTLQELEAAGAALVSYDPDTGVAYVTANDTEERALHAAGFAVSTLELDFEAGLKRLQQDPGLGLYTTWAELVLELERLHATFPELTVLEVLGQTLEGRDIHALKISDEPTFDDPDEADVLIVGNHHARELMSVEVPLHFARTLLATSRQDPAVRRLVESREVWIVPMLNPDGHVYQEETQGRPGWRKNRRAEGDHVVGVDLNRNYTFQWGFDDRGSSPEPLSETYRGRSALSEPESQALARLVERQSFTIALSYHSFGELLLYPWGYTRDVKAPDHDVYVALAEKMVRDNGYRPGNAFSGAIYLTNGVWDDYMYGETRGAKSTPTFAFTVELNSLQDGGFWPPDGLIQPTCDRLLSLNMYTLEVAADVYAATPPRAPVLSATQDESDGRIIHLRWQQPGDAGRIDHYEVFEIDPVGSPSAWKQARAARLERSGRTILAQGVRVSDSGRLALRLEAALEPLWDYAYVEVRAAGTNSWTSLSGDGTRHDSPTRRNDGHGLTGFLEPRVRVFDAGVYASRRVDVAVRLDAYGDTPTAPRLTASVDVPETITEERRVIDPEVHETFYDVVAERPGLFAYGVTAVDLEGQRTDSDIFWFMIPEPTAVELQDVALEHSDETARLRWTILSDTPARFEVWSRPLSAHEVPASAGAEWGQHAYERVAQRVVSRPGDTSLAWETRPGRHAVLLAAMDPDGPRLWGPWVVQRAARTRLAAARPNPFNPSTILRYETASSTRVVFDIVSVDGQHIRRLVAADVPAGTHTARWDGRDDAGRGVASGVYVARLQADGVVLTRRLVLLR